ncbi:MAG: hypothetical protein IKD89_03170 [Clostridia bacterium]|nr:hypothetical protein [Clostridia bacterium]
MQNIIGEIIGAEAEARKITGDAVKKRESINEDVKAQVTVLREQRMAEARRQIEEKLSAQTAELNEKVKAAESEYEKKASEIDAAYNKNKDSWIDLAFKKVIGK